METQGSGLPQGWQEARETQPAIASWGAGWGPRPEQRMPGSSAQTGDGVMEKGGRVYTEGRGAAGGEPPTRAALFQALERGKAAERHPRLHPAAPFIHALPSTPPQLEEKQLCKGRLSPGQPPPPEVASWEERSPFSLPQVPLKYHGLWVPTLGFPFTLCTTVFNSLVPSSAEDLGPSPSLPSQDGETKVRNWDESLSPSSLHSTLKFLL